MTTIYDAVDVAAIPASAQIILAYIDGGYRTFNAVRARFPNALILTVTTNGLNSADICDVESGDATPAIAARGVAAGLYGTVYSDTSTHGALVAAIRGAWQWYAADPTGTPHLVPGSVATQWAWPGHGSPGNYDISVTNGVYPNAPAPVTPPNPQPAPAPGVDDMTHDWLIRNCYRVVLHREVDSGGYTTWANFLQGGGDPGEMWAQVQDSAEGQAVLAAERNLLGLH